MSTEIAVDDRFAGFEGLAQGGYVAGTMARLAGEPIEVTLRAPIPLGVPLECSTRGAGVVVLRQGEEVVAESAPDIVDVPEPGPVSLSDAESSSRSYPGFEGHLFPGCFACGPQRSVGDGLRIFPGLLADGLVAAPWYVSDQDAGTNGTLPEEIVWAAMDCPAIWALILYAPADETLQVVSGRISGRLLAPVRAGDACIVLAWPMGGEGRRLFSGVALYTKDGELIAVGKQTCVVVDRGIPLALDAWRKARRND